jgi:hypothetical protein
MSKEGKREGAKANPPVPVIANPQGEAMMDMHIIYVHEFPYVRDAMKAFRELSKPEFDVMN